MMSMCLPDRCSTIQPAQRTTESPFRTRNHHIRSLLSPTFRRQLTSIKTLKRSSKPLIGNDPIFVFIRGVRGKCTKSLLHTVVVWPTHHDLLTWGRAINTNSAASRVDSSPREPEAVGCATKSLLRPIFSCSDLTARLLQESINSFIFLRYGHSRVIPCGLFGGRLRIA